MQSVYPAIESFQTHRLKVDPPFELYIEECGNPEGIPAVFLHGGPGAGFKLSQRRTFDPDRFRMIFFDQRGAGRSTPAAEIAGNDTQALIADIERIRAYLGVDRWLVSGGSWGSCLSLAYGEAHPDRCLGFRLHGVFLARRAEIDWWFHGGRSIFPDCWDDLAGFVPEDERDDLLQAYYRRLTSDDPALRQEAALNLRRFSARTQTFVPDPDHVRALTAPEAALPLARLFTHYCVNGGFLEEGQLLRDIGRIRHLPAEIVQGRYDVVCPMTSAWDLHKAWPEARFTCVDLANHVTSPLAPALEIALCEATDRLGDRLCAETQDQPEKSRSRN